MSSVRLLGYGIDTLVVNLYWDEGAYSLPEGLEATLDNLKELGRVEPDAGVLWGVDAYLPLPNPLAGWTGSEVEPELFQSAAVRSVRHYRWMLDFAGLIFWRLSSVKETTRRANFPAMRVEFTGRYLMYARRRADEVVRWAVEAATNLVGVRPSRVQVSRADLFCDVEVPHGYFTLDSLNRFTSRSRARGLYAVEPAAPGEAGAPATGGPMSITPPATRLRVPESWEEAPAHLSAHLRGRDWSGFTFGRGPLHARVYSKTIEAKAKPGARALLEMYGQEHGPIEGEVIRVEFQLTTEALAEIIVPGDGSDVRDWDTFVWAVPAIWAYLTGDWLVYRQEGGYRRMRDNEVDAVWVVVQSAFRSGEVGRGGVVRHAWKAMVDPVMLAKQALGAYMTALVAVGKVVDRVRGVWVRLFRELGLDKEGEEALGKIGFWSVRKAERVKLAKFGFMPVGGV
ncbi:hypothetical protein TJA_17120 [Thermus sp. LT1-2-5]|uniref:hypothetical protein n=1 Tax=Thermus sp. LT1-2-5 TaxID=3026935 RepID=UPI0030E94FF1